MKTMAERIRQRMAELSLRQDRLARLCGTTQPSINRLLNGETRNPQYIYELAKALETSVKWLKTGIEDFEYTTSQIPAHGLAEGDRFSLHAKIPVWSVPDIREGAYALPSAENTPVDFIEPIPAQKTDKDAFGLLVAEESMAPRYEPGNIACIHTRKPPIRGCDCVIELKNGTGMIRRYLGMQGNNYIVEQLNPPKTTHLKKSDVVRMMPIVGILYMI